MRLIAKLSTGHVVAIWSVSLLLVASIFVVAGWMVHPYHNAMLRRFALAHPNGPNTDSLAPRTWEPANLSPWERQHSASRDSLMWRTIKLVPADTVEDPYGESLAAQRRSDWGIGLAYAGLLLLLAVPVLLAVLTVWWLYLRRKAPKRDAIAA